MQNNKSTDWVRKNKYEIDIFIERKNEEYAGNLENYHG